MAQARDEDNAEGANVAEAEKWEKTACFLGPMRNGNTEFKLLEKEVRTGWLG